MVESNLLKPGNRIIFDKPNPRFKAFLYAGVHHFLIDSLGDEFGISGDLYTKINLLAQGKFDPGDFKDPIIVYQKFFFDMCPRLLYDHKPNFPSSSFGSFTQAWVDEKNLVSRGRQ